MLYRPRLTALLRQRGRDVQRQPLDLLGTEVVAAAGAEDEGVLAHEHVVAVGLLAVVHKHARAVQSVLRSARPLADQITCT